MKKINERGGAVLIIIILIVIVGVVGFALTRNGSDLDLNKDGSPEMMESDEMMMDDGHSDEKMVDNESAMMEGGDMMASAGSYESYSSEKVSEAGADQKTVIFFHASWCPTCKTQDAAIVAAKDSIPTDVVILKADYDQETELKKKYGVTVQHTFVQVDSDGNMITKWSGGSDLDGIVSKLK